MSRRARLVVASVLLASASSATAAPGEPSEPTKQECVAANSAAQDLRSAGKLRHAHKKLAACIATSCPGPVREDCADRLRELEKAMPSLIFEAKDAAGNDLGAVVVLIDGQPLAKELDGAALVVDPGEHTFTFETAGRPKVDRTLVVREGEKARHERVTFGAARPKEAPSQLPPQAPAPIGEGSSRVPAVVAFGVGGVGLVVGLVFTGLWASDKSAGDTACANGCAPDIADSWTSKQNGDTAGIVVGFVAAGAGAVVGTIWLLTSSGPRPARTAAPATGVRPRVGLGWLGFEARF